MIKLYWLLLPNQLPVFMRYNQQRRNMDGVNKALFTGKRTLSDKALAITPDPFNRTNRTDFLIELNRT